MTNRDNEHTALDAVRLLCNAIQKVQHFDREQEGISPLCKNHGELILQDALEYLAWGDTHNARAVMDTYETWKRNGEAPWPYDNTKPQPSHIFEEEDSAFSVFEEFEEDPGGGWQRKGEADEDFENEEKSDV